MPGTPLKPFAARLAAIGVDAQPVVKDIVGMGFTIVDVPARSEIRSARNGSFDILLRGWAYRYRYLPDGTRHIAGLILPGEPCNIDALGFRGDIFHFGTLTPCVIAAIDGRAFENACNSNPDMRRAVSILAIAENAMLREWSLSLARRTAGERMAHVFCELKVRLSSVGETGTDGYVLPLTQVHLGELLGLTPVHINRTLRSLRDEGLVELSGQRLRVPDWSALAELADFNPDYLQVRRATA